MKLHHFGIVVHKLSQSIQIYLKLGYEYKSDVVFDWEQHNKVVFLTNKEINIELIEPIDELSTVYNTKAGYHHICFEAEPGEDIIKNFKEMKIGRVFTSPIVAPALNNRKVVFACLQNGTLIEFITQQIGLYIVQ